MGILLVIVIFFVLGVVVMAAVLAMKFVLQAVLFTVSIFNSLKSKLYGSRN